MYSIRATRWLQLLLLVAVAPHASAEQSAYPCRVINLMPAFWKFWEAAKGADEAQQERIFKSTVVDANPAVYEAAFSGIPADYRLSWSQYSAKWLPYERRMRQLSSSLDSEIPAALEQFRRALPDFHCTSPIYFLFSYGAFDGAVRSLNGEPALMFGIDVIARVHGNNLYPLVSHELFHRYHGQSAPASSSALYWALWQEGLATFASRQLNPGIAERDVCCMPAELDRVKASLGVIVCELLRHLDSDDRKINARFFLGGPPQAGLPSRSGYYVGYLVASAAGQRRSLPELVRLSPKEVRKIARTELRKLVKRTSSAPRK